MLARIYTICLHGIEPKEICVEVNVTSRGFPSLDIVGMAGKNVQESKERVRSAIISSGYDFPQKKVLVNLMPADLPKDGTSFDLPIAVGILACTMNLSIPSSALFYGELTLGGLLNYTKGCFNLGVYIADKFHNVKNEMIAYIPAKSAVELENIPRVPYFYFTCLRDLIMHLQGKNPLSLSVGKRPSVVLNTYSNNQRSSISNSIHISDIKGQDRAKRALLVSLAGKHNILFIGSPGSGKTMLAKSAHSLLPPLCFEDSLEVTKVYSSSGLLTEAQGLITQAPFRSPHHSSSTSGILGGGSSFRIGEITLAHKGILLLDELPEFSVHALESLRQPLEDKYINLTKCGYSLSLPSDFILIATANPCPCGYYGDSTRSCTCSSLQRIRYLSRVSGPILDRIDLVVPVHTVNNELQSTLNTLNTNSKAGDTVSNFSSSAATMQENIDLVRVVQQERFKNLSKDTVDTTFSNLSSILSTLSSENLLILSNALNHFRFSRRTLDKILRMSRTIADLEKSSEITSNHILEAISYKTSYLEMLSKA